MKQHNFDDITLALAGILQTTACVKQLAETGRVNESAFATSIQSVFQFDAQEVKDVFGDMQSVKLGLEQLILLCDSSQPTDKTQRRYFLSLIRLQKKLMRTPVAFSALTKRLQKVHKQANYFSVTHPTVVGNLADIYLDTISIFRYRFIIFSKQHIVQAAENLNKMRALLLAGLRAAVLWQQVGGSRLHLLFYRAKIKTSAEKWLQQISLLEKDYV